MTPAPLKKALQLAAEEAKKTGDFSRLMELIKQVPNDAYVEPHPYREERSKGHIA